MADLTKDRMADNYLIARASQYSAPESGGDALPIIYGDLTVPARTEAGVYSLPKINTGGSGTYCIAGHAIDGSVSLFDDDGLINPGEYTLNLANDYEGNGEIATAVFSVAPSGSVTAVCKGKKDSSSILLENPALIAEDLALNFWGFFEQDIDRQTLSRAAASAQSQGYAAASVISDDHAPADALTDLLGNFLGRFEVDAFGRLKIIFQGTETGSIHPVKVMPELEAAEVELEVSRDGVINQVPALYAWDDVEGKFLLHEDGIAERSAASQVLYGVRTPSSGRLELTWMRSEAVARTVQARIVERFEEPARVFRIQDETFRALEVEPDDYIVFSVPWLRSAEMMPLHNQIGQVISSAPDLKEQTLELSLRDTGYFLTTACLADGTCAGLGRKAVGAIEFDGASGAVTVSDDAAIQNIFDDGGTIECWFNARTDGENNGGILVSKRFPGTDGYRLQVKSESGGMVAVNIDIDFDVTDAQAATEVEVATNTLQHVVLTFTASSGETPIIYIAGTAATLASSQAASGTRLTDAGNDLLIGDRTDDALSFDGFIDEVRIYKGRILSAAEVAEHYNGIFNDETDLAGYWPLNEGASSLARDASVNLNHGTLSGNAAFVGAASAAQGPKDSNYADGSKLAGGARDTSVYA
ncbi:MAG: LamG domain-containing protein [Nitrospinaceae bacterium]|nr:LamG domain-containing protein [Nitrospinaceae bacterium]MBT4432338.1 LamG domain-containing protein [Nitrospinaceae bacterium]MBT5366692.1 LamG domain-containing protein [Nitrospinaceae bacterium]MBT5948422.1 LamG domain-containing protein [Nitrospinaceae bacterium]MBT6396451.1 LamG domain-containing protein [Nitrospinaceae bacterium]